MTLRDAFLRRLSNANPSLLRLVFLLGLRSFSAPRRPHGSPPFLSSFLSSLSPCHIPLPPARSCSLRLRNDNSTFSAASRVRGFQTWRQPLAVLQNSRENANNHLLTSHLDYAGRGVLVLHYFSRLFALFLRGKRLKEGKKKEEREKGRKIPARGSLRKGNRECG